VTASRITSSRLGKIDPDDQVLVLAERPPWSQHRARPAGILCEGGSQTVQGRVPGRWRNWPFYSGVLLSDIVDLRDEEVQAVPGGLSHSDSVPGASTGHGEGRRRSLERFGRGSTRRSGAGSNDERLLYRILCDVDVTEDPDQGGHGASGLLAEDPTDRGRADGG
jgi:hypothetical protein